MRTEELAWNIRYQGIEMTHASHGSHIASILSVADVLAVLYNDVMHISPENPASENRDRLILSKGHAGAAVYAVLAYKGFFDRSLLGTMGADGGKLSGHVSHKGVPGVEMSTGSLGHGIGVGCGMAMAARHDGKKHKVYVIMGDGECEEGSVWEAALFARHHQLGNLVVTIDHNKMQALGECKEITALLPLAEKWRAFGWHVQEVDGHDIAAIRSAYQRLAPDVPNCIVAHTVKGKGVPFMENKLLWHYRDPQGEYYNAACHVLEQERP